MINTDYLNINGCVNVFLCNWGCELWYIVMFCLIMPVLGIILSYLHTYMFDAGNNNVCTYMFASYDRIFVFLYSHESD